MLAAIEKIKANRESKTYLTYNELEAIVTACAVEKLPRKVARYQLRVLTDYSWKQLLQRVSHTIEIDAQDRLAFKEAI